MNFLAVPIALRALGQERYAAFATLFGLAGWLTIGNSGLASATAVFVSEFKDDDRRRHEFFWRSAISTFLAVAVVSAVAFVPFIQLSTHLVGNGSAALSQELTRAAYYCFAVFMVCAVGQTFEGYYVGTLRVEYVNWCRLVGQVAGIGAVIWLPPLFANMLAVCFATTLGTASAAIWFTVKAIAECPPPIPLNYSVRRSLPLFRQGVGFLASSLSTLFYGGASLPLIAMSFGPGQLATAAVMSRMVTMYFSVIAALLIPLAPALRNALASDDQAWVQKAMRNSGAFMAAAAIGAAFGIVFLGDVVIRRWTGTDLPGLSEWLIPMAALLIAISWSYFWIYACFATRGSLPVAMLALAEIVLICGQFVLFGRNLPPSSSLLIMAGTMMLLSGTILPTFVIRDLNARFRRIDSAMGRTAPENSAE
ncbi:MAG: polysaccharide biosynthesis protein [Rhodospirillales bacterium]|nr:polysaccharide biosynthesis protein [Rhodospirillales bacterium]